MDDGDRNGIAAAAAVNEVVDRRVVDRSPYPSVGNYGGIIRERGAVSMFLRPTPLSVIAPNLCHSTHSGGRATLNAVGTAMMTECRDPGIGSRLWRPPAGLQ